MPINFPVNPSLNDVFSVGGVSYRWNGVKWVVVTYAVSGGPTGPTGSTGPTGPQPDLSVVSVDVLPSSDLAFDLGASDYRWRDLYLSGSSIFLGDAVLSSSDGGLSIASSSGGSVAFLTASDAASFATAAQGSLADTAVQPSDSIVVGDGGTIGSISATDAISIASDGDIGIGISTTSARVRINGDNDVLTDLSIPENYHLSITNNADDTGEAVGISFGITSESATSTGASIYHERKGTYSYGDLAFATRPSGGNVTERMRIDSDGRVGIGTANPLAELHITDSSVNAVIRLESSSTGNGIINFDDQDNTNVGRLVYDHSDNSMQFFTNTAEAMRINSSGNVGIGTTDPPKKFTIFNGSSGESGTINTNTVLFIENSSDAIIQTRSPNTSYAGMIFTDNTSIPGGILYAHNGTTENNVLGLGAWVKMSFRVEGTEGIFEKAERMSITTSGVTIAGSLSKGSGSFKIDHPLKPETHYLVHSFVEGPKADLIYRGKVNLVDGKAIVNIDTAAGMTEGTFVELNREVQCFTSNESGWTAVRGSILGNILTIESQDDTCTDTVSWMVVGERKDTHMYDTEWTDENGKVILEPEKEVN